MLAPPAGELVPPLMEILDPPLVKMISWANNPHDDYQTFANGCHLFLLYVHVY